MDCSKRVIIGSAHELSTAAGSNSAAALELYVSCVGMFPVASRAVRFVPIPLHVVHDLTRVVACSQSTACEQLRPFQGPKRQVGCLRFVFYSREGERHT